MSSATAPGHAQALLVLALASCTLPSAPECSIASTCDLSIGGACVRGSSGRMWCQYPETSGECESGFRWSLEAGDGLARQCVIPVDADVDASSDIDGGSDGTAEDAAVPDSSPPDAAVDAAADSAITDAGPDASPDATTSGPVSVTVFDKDWKPVSGADVLVHDQLGAITATGTTNGAGIAMASAPIAGMVTIAHRTTNVEFITTITGVQPGDLLTAIDLDTSLYAGPQIGTASINLAGTYSGATAYSLASSCQSSFGSLPDPSGNVSGTVYRDCSDSDNDYDVIEAASAAAGPLAFSLGRFHWTSATPSIVLTGWSSTKSMSIQVKNMPAAAMGSSFTAAVTFHDAAINVPHETVSTNLYRISAPDPEHASSTLGVLGKLVIDFPSEGPNFSEVLLNESIPIIATQPEIDANSIPRLHNIVVSDADLGRPRVSWQLDAIPTGLVGGYVLLIWPSTGVGKPEIDWLIVIPPGNQVRAPELSSAVAALIPKVEPGASVVLGDTGIRAPTYAALRNWFIPYLDLKLKAFARVTLSGSAFK